MPFRSPFRVSLLFILPAVLFSCSVSDRFENYRGVNLIENYTLSEWTPDYNDVSTPTPANSGSAYMRYESAGLVGPNGEEAYLLRTKNLLPNGDFEATSEGSAPAGWAASGTGPFGAFSVTAAGAISGKSLTYTIANAADVLSYNLDNLSDGFLFGSTYNFRFAMSFPQQNLSFEINEATDNPVIRNPLSFDKPGTLSSYTFPSDDFSTSSLNNSATRFASGTATYFHINNLSDASSRSGQSGTIDNIRFLRNDLTYKIRLKLRQTDAKHDLLPSGTYQLSVYVKQDPAAGSSNILSATQIALGINQNWVGPGTFLTPVTPGSFTDDTAVGIEAESAWSDWTEVSAVFKNVQIDAPATDEDYNIELTISATDSQSGFTRDCGSILIASPSLEFLPDE